MRLKKQLSEHRRKYSHVVNHKSENLDRVGPIQSPQLANLNIQGGQSRQRMSPTRGGQRRTLQIIGMEPQLQL